MIFYFKIDTSTKNGKYYFKIPIIEYAKYIINIYFSYVNISR